MLDVLPNWSQQYDTSMSEKCLGCQTQIHLNELMAEFQPSNNTISNTYVCSAVTQATHHGQSQLQYGSILHPHTVGAVMSPAALLLCFSK